jgi:DHA1 family tetracycline resistance protein-like MFS transporter
MKNSRLGIIFVTVFIDLVGFGMILPLTPYLATKFNASAVEVAMLLSVYSLMQFICSPIWGRISDRIGRRPVLLVSLLGSSLSHLAFAFSNSYWLLFAARLFAGAFTANISTAMAYIADVTPEKERSKSMGIIGAAFGMGFVLGPAIGGGLSHVGFMLGENPPLGMSFPALGAALICFVNFLIAIRRLTESLPPEKRVVRQLGSRIRSLFAGFQKPVVGSLMLVYFLGGLGMANMESTLGLHLKDQFAWSLERASYMFAVVGIVMAFCQGYLIRKFMPKFGERNILIAGVVFSALGMAGMAMAHSIPLLAAGIITLTVGISFINPSVVGCISLLTPSDHQGGTLGQTQSLSALGRIIGPLMGGYFYQTVTVYTPFWAGSAIFVLAGLLLIPVFNRIPQTGRA